MIPVVFWKGGDMKKGENPFLCSRRNFLKKVLFGSLAFNRAFAVAAGYGREVYPAERIVWVSPYKVGGGFDLMVRGISPYLTKHLREISPGAKGGEVIIKNETRAGGQRAYEMVYAAKPDGYTIGAFDMAFAAETLMSKLPFDLHKFTYLVRVMNTKRLMVTYRDGFPSWAEMVKYARTKELKWGVGAVGRGLTIDSIIVKETVGIPARLIPWGGTTECMNALLRKDVQVALVSEDSVKGLLNSGEIKVLIVFSDKSDYPGIPSIKDVGYPDLAEKLGSHRFVVAPPLLDKKVFSLLLTAFKKVFNDISFQAWAQKMDIPLSPLLGEEAALLAERMINYYQRDLKPMLIKYL